MIVKNVAEMLAFGRDLASELKAGDWLAIDGPLGAGKTVLCRGILQGLGFTGEVASPSYALIHPYEPPDVRIAAVHADLYRLENRADLDELGLSDDADDCITLVEWAKNAGGGYGNPTYWIEITPQDDGSRHIEMKRDNG